MYFHGRYGALTFWRQAQLHIIRRIISLFIVLSFIFPSIAWAFQPSLPVGAILYHQQDLQIPKNLGSLKEAYQGSSGPLVIYIQDLHCNYEVQTHISQIIDQLAENQGLQLVVSEGASGNVDAGPLSSFSSAWVKSEVGKYLMRQGKLTGTEFYAATGQHPIRLMGVESEDLYQENLSSALRILSLENQGHLQDLREALDQLKPGIYSAALRQWDEVQTGYHDNKISLLEFTSKLCQQASRQGLDISNFTNVKKYAVSGQTGADLDNDGLIRELNGLEVSLRERLYSSSEERRLDDLQARLGTVEKLMNISATVEELQQFRAHPENYRAEVFTNYVREHSTEGGEEFDPEILSLNQWLDEALKFYKVADERSRAFVQNTLAAMKAQNKDLVLLVTGGYHTADILAALRKQNISYLCVQPVQTHQDVANPYFSILSGRLSPLEKFLEKNQNILSPRLSFGDRQHLTLLKQSLAVLCGSVTLAQAATQGARTVPGLRTDFGSDARLQALGPAWDTAYADKESAAFLVPLANAGLAVLIRQQDKILRHPVSLAQLPLGGYLVELIGLNQVAEAKTLLATEGQAMIVRGLDMQTALLASPLAALVGLGGTLAVAPTLGQQWLGKAGRVLRGFRGVISSGMALVAKLFLGVAIAAHRTYISLTEFSSSFATVVRKVFASLFEFGSNSVNTFRNAYASVTDFCAGRLQDWAEAIIPNAQPGSLTHRLANLVLRLNLSIPGRLSLTLAFLFGSGMWLLFGLVVDLTWGPIAALVKAVRMYGLGNGAALRTALLAIVFELPGNLMGWFRNAATARGLAATGMAVWVASCGGTMSMVQPSAARASQTQGWVSIGGGFYQSGERIIQLAESKSGRTVVAGFWVQRTVMEGLAYTSLSISEDKLILHPGKKILAATNNDLFPLRFFSADGKDDIVTNASERENVKRNLEKNGSPRAGASIRKMNAWLMDHGFKPVASAAGLYSHPDFHGLLVSYDGQDLLIAAQSERLEELQNLEFLGFSGRQIIFKRSIATLAMGDSDYLKTIKWDSDMQPDLSLTKKQSFTKTLNSGFKVGGVNSNATIARMHSLAGIPIGVIESRAIPRMESESGFMGVDEKFQQILMDDNDWVLSRGYTHQQLAKPLLDIINLFELGPRPEVMNAKAKAEIAAQPELNPQVNGCVIGYVNNAVITYNGSRYRMMDVGCNGDQDSLFNDNLIGSRDFEVENLETGERLRFSELVSYYIQRYGFYEGKGTPYRVPPERIVSMFNLKPSRPKAPQAKIAVASSSEEHIPDLAEISKKKFLSRFKALSTAEQNRLGYAALLILSFKKYYRIRFKEPLLYDPKKDYNSSLAGEPVWFDRLFKIFIPNMQMDPRNFDFDDMQPIPHRVVVDASAVRKFWAGQIAPRVIDSAIFKFLNVPLQHLGQASDPEIEDAFQEYFSEGVSSANANEYRTVQKQDYERKAQSAAKELAAAFPGMVKIAAKSPHPLAPAEISFMLEQKEKLSKVLRETLEADDLDESWFNQPAAKPGSFLHWQEPVGIPAAQQDAMWKVSLPAMAANRVKNDRTFVAAERLKTQAKNQRWSARTLRPAARASKGTPRSFAGDSTLLRKLTLALLPISEVTYNKYLVLFESAWSLLAGAAGLLGLFLAARLGNITFSWLPVNTPTEMLGSALKLTLLAFPVLHLDRIFRLIGGTSLEPAPITPWGNVAAAVLISLVTGLLWLALPVAVPVLLQLAIVFGFFVTFHQDVNGFLGLPKTAPVKNYLEISQSMKKNGTIHARTVQVGRAGKAGFFNNPEIPVGLAAGMFAAMAIFLVLPALLGITGATAIIIAIVSGIGVGTLAGWLFVLLARNMEVLLKLASSFILAFRQGYTILTLFGSKLLLAALLNFPVNLARGIGRTVITKQGLAAGATVIAMVTSSVSASLAQTGDYGSGDFGKSYSDTIAIHKKLVHFIEFDSMERDQTLPKLLQSDNPAVALQAARAWPTYRKPFPHEFFEKWVPKFSGKYTTKNAQELSKVDGNVILEMLTIVLNTATPVSTEFLGSFLNPHEKIDVVDLYLLEPLLVALSRAQKLEFPPIPINWLWADLLNQRFMMYDHQGFLDLFQERPETAIPELKGMDAYMLAVSSTSEKLKTSDTWKKITSEIVREDIDSDPSKQNLLEEYYAYALINLIKSDYTHNQEEIPADLNSIAMALLHLVRTYASDLQGKTFSEQMAFARRATNLILAERKQVTQNNTIIFGPGQRVVTVSNQEKRFSSKELQGIAKYFGSNVIASIKGASEIAGARQVKNNYFRILRQVASETGKPTTVYHNGHGGPSHFWLSNGTLGHEVSNELRHPLSISYREIAENLIQGQLLKKSINQGKLVKIDLSHLTLIFDACYQYDMVKKILDEEFQRIADEKKIEIISPIIIAASLPGLTSNGALRIALTALAGKQNQHQKEISTYLGMTNNLKTAKSGQYTLGDLLGTTDHIRKVHMSPPALFVPVDPETVMEKLGLPKTAPVKNYLEISRTKSGKHAVTVHAYGTAAAHSSRNWQAFINTAIQILFVLLADPASDFAQGNWHVLVFKAVAMVTTGFFGLISILAAQNRTWIIKKYLPRGDLANSDGSLNDSQLEALVRLKNSPWAVERRLYQLILLHESYSSHFIGTLVMNPILGWLFKLVFRPYNYTSPVGLNEPILRRDVIDQAVDKYIHDKQAASATASTITEMSKPGKPALEIQPQGLQPSMQWNEPILYQLPGWLRFRPILAVSLFFRSLRFRPFSNPGALKGPLESSPAIREILHTVVPQVAAEIGRTGQATVLSLPGTLSAFGTRGWSRWGHLPGLFLGSHKYSPEQGLVIYLPGYVLQALARGEAPDASSQELQQYAQAKEMAQMMASQQARLYARETAWLTEQTVASNQAYATLDQDLTADLEKPQVLSWKQGNALSEKESAAARLQAGQIQITRTELTAYFRELERDVDQFADMVQSTNRINWSRVRTERKDDLVSQGREQLRAALKARLAAGEDLTAGALLNLLERPLANSNLQIKLLRLQLLNARSALAGAKTSAEQHHLEQALHAAESGVLYNLIGLLADERSALTVQEAQQLNDLPPRKVIFECLSFEERQEMQQALARARKCINLSTNAGYREVFEKRIAALEQVLRQNGGGFTELTQPEFKNILVRSVLENRLVMAGTVVEISDLTAHLETVTGARVYLAVAGQREMPAGPGTVSVPVILEVATHESAGQIRAQVAQGAVQVEAGEHVSVFQQKTANPALVKNTWLRQAAGYLLLAAAAVIQVMDAVLAEMRITSLPQFAASLKFRFQALAFQIAPALVLSRALRQLKTETLEVLQKSRLRPYFPADNQTLIAYLNSSQPLPTALRALAQQPSSQNRDQVVKTLLRIIRPGQKLVSWEESPEINTADWLMFSAFIAGLGCVPSVEIAEPKPTNRIWKQRGFDHFRESKLSMPAVLLNLRGNRGWLGFVTDRLSQGNSPFELHQDIIDMFLRRGIMSFSGSA